MTESVVLMQEQSHRRPRQRRGRTPSEALRDVSVSTGGASAMHHVGTEGSSCLIEMRTIDSYALHPTIMKIDVEGYEEEVLAGAKKPRGVLSWWQFSPRIITRAPSTKAGIESISSFMSDHGFTAVTYNPWHRTVTAKNNRSGNTLYIRDIEKVKRRVAEAKPFRVFGRSI